MHWPTVTVRLAVPLVLLTLVAAACSTPSSVAPSDPARSAGDPQPPREVESLGAPDATPDPPAPPCRRDQLEQQAVVELTDHDVRAAAAQIATRTHRCAPTVVIAAIDGGWSAALAVPVALAQDAPLLLADPQNPSRVVDVLDGLEAERVVTVGMQHSGFGRPGTALMAPADRIGGATSAGAPRSGTAASAVEALEAAPRLALTVAAHLGVRRFLAVPVGDERARAAALSRADATTALLPVPDDGHMLARLAEALPPDARVHVLATGQDAAASLAGQLLAVGIDAERIDGSMWPEAEATTWLVDPRQADAAAVAAVAAIGRGDSVLPIDGSDLRTGREDTSRLRDADLERAVLVGKVTDDASWQLPLVLDGPTLPGGGFRLFEARRLVALYGHPRNQVVGALGEQDLDQAIDRLRDTAEPYSSDGVQVLPALEIVATLASSEPGPRGEFSRRSDPDVLAPWIERAAREELYVLLDLQPGRSDFLEQAREYEQLLREPHVGLALDPEWRLAPGERHHDHVGAVEADEVQRVVDWLADLTREAGLPEKLLVLHQFQPSMLPDRDTIEVPAELAVVVHMDGQGPLHDKFDSYASITAGAEDRWLWGWRNAYDQDDPVATAQQVLDLEPTPVLVTYE